MPLGLVIGLAAAARFRNPWPAVAMLVVGVVLDVVEERLAAKCPTCAVALDLVRVVARA